MEKIIQGTHTTRFKQGFHRRHESKIGHDVERKAQTDAKDMAAAEHLERRRDRLGQINDYNGFNPISGDFDPAKDFSKRKEVRASEAATKPRARASRRSSSSVVF